MPAEQTTHTDFQQTIDRCAAAYRRVRAELKPKDIGYNADRENNYKAYLAFSAELPILSNPASFQLYVACIAKGVAIGAIDIGDAGRLCHIVQTAMSVWKLANLTIPAAQNKEKEAARRSEQKETPLPPKGNYPELDDLDQALQRALNQLPAFEVQNKHFLLLRSRGHLLPSDPELRDNPLAALHFVRQAEQLLRQEALASIQPSPQPAREPAPDRQDQPKQAA